MTFASGFTPITIDEFLERDQVQLIRNKKVLEPYLQYFADTNQIYHDIVMGMDRKRVLTADGLLASTFNFTEDISKSLIQFWNHRKNQPNLVEQPVAQWPEVQAAPSSFRGYKPETVPYNPKKYIGTFEMAKRMTAASLINEDLKNWDNFD